MILSTDGRRIGQEGGTIRFRVSRCIQKPQHIPNRKKWEDRMINKKIGIQQTKRYPVVDPGYCNLCQGCIEVASKVFRFNFETGLIEVVDMSRYPEDLVDEAIKNCPEDCITWEK